MSGLAFRLWAVGATNVTGSPQYTALPILTGPYSRRRLMRLRAPLQRYGIIVTGLTAAGLLLGLIF